MSRKNIGFIGGGNMASAIINGLMQSHAAVNIHVCDAVAAVRERHEKDGRHVYESIADCCKAVEVIILAVKPQHFYDIAEELKDAIDQQLVISILAGVTIKQIESALGDGVPVVRSMPNTPMMVSQGMVGLAAGSHASEDDIQSAEHIFEVSANILRIDESRMNALTAVSGSGPAYVFHFCEMLMEAARELGFNQEEAQLLVSQTVRGSIAYLCSQEGFPAARLREQVTSKGGTTAAALNVFNDADLSSIYKRALSAARDRGEELSGQT